MVEGCEIPLNDIQGGRYEQSATIALGPGVSHVDFGSARVVVHFKRFLCALELTGVEAEIVRRAGSATVAALAEEFAETWAAFRAQIRALERARVVRLLLAVDPFY